MSTLTSSAINKSGKTVAPKPVARRRPAAARAQAPVSSIQDEAQPAPTNTVSDVAETPAPQEQVDATQPTPASEIAQLATQATATHFDQNRDESYTGHSSGEQDALPTPHLEQAPVDTQPSQANDSQEAESRNDKTVEHAPESLVQEAHDPTPADPPPVSEPREHGQEVVSQAEALVDAAATSENVSGNATTSTRTASRAISPPQPVAGAKRKRKQPNGRAASHSDGGVDDSAAGTSEQQENPAPKPQPKPRTKRQKKQQEPDLESTNAAASAATPVATIENDVQQEEPGREATKRKARAKPSRKGAPNVSNEAESNSQETGPEHVKAKPKRPRKPRAKAVEQHAQDVQQDGDGAEVSEKEQEEKEVEDPELHEIDADNVTMSQLTRARNVGKVSEREKKMAEIDWFEVARKRREQVPIVQNAEEETRAESEAQPDREASTPHTPGRPRGVQLRMVNGQMVINDESRTIDRQAEAIAGALGGPINQEEDLTLRINRTTWMEKKKRDPAERVPVYKMKSDPWSDEETDRFFDALRMFGTDFFIISKMFPPKTRRQIKLKFIREERLDRDKINKALLGENVAMDLEHFAEVTGQEIEDFRDPRELDEELEREGQEQRIEIEQKKKDMVEAQKQRNIQMEAREQEKAEREQQKQAQKDQRALIRARKRRGQMGTGTL